MKSETVWSLHFFRRLQSGKFCHRCRVIVDCWLLVHMCVLQSLNEMQSVGGEMVLLVSQAHWMVDGSSTCFLTLVAQGLHVLATSPKLWQFSCSRCARYLVVWGWQVHQTTSQITESVAYEQQLTYGLCGWFLVQKNRVLDRQPGCMHLRHAFKMKKLYSDLQ